MSKIDRDRGALIRKHPSGYRVCMYVDSPGVYYDDTGNRVDASIALEAGFDVGSDMKSKAKHKLRTNYERQISAKFAEVEVAVDEMIEENPDILDELTVAEVEDGNWAVIDGDENPITSTRLTEDEAITLYEGITGNTWEQSSSSAPKDEVNPFLGMKSKEIRELLKEAEVDVPTGLRMPKLAEFANEHLELEDDPDSTGNDLL